jgi:hypothetical protein
LEPTEGTTEKVNKKYSEEKKAGNSNRVKLFGFIKKGKKH